MNEKPPIDAVDQKILIALTEDARLSMRGLSGHIGMSAPSTAQRVRRLTDMGAIQGYTTDLDLKALGYSVQAIVRIKPLPGQLGRVEQTLRHMPECIECDKVTGEDCFIALICFSTIEAMESVMAPLKDRAETHTSIIHGTVMRRRSPLSFT